MDSTLFFFRSLSMVQTRRGTYESNKCRAQGLVLDTKTKACRPSKRGSKKGSRTSALWFNRPGANGNAKLMGSSEWALAGARAKSNPCKYGPKVDIGGKARCPTTLSEANPAFKARYCKSGKYDVMVGKIPAYVVNPKPGAKKVCVKNPDTKASKRSVMSGTALSTGGFRIVNGQVVPLGYTKNDLVKNPSGRIVSKAKRAQGLATYASQSKETRAKFLDQQARARARVFAANKKKSKTSGLWFNQPFPASKNGPTLKERAADCQAQGKVLNKKTKRCRESKSKTSGGQALKELAAICKSEGKVLNRATRQCRDKKKAKRRAPKADSIAALRKKCSELGKVLNVKKRQCRPRKSRAKKA